MKFAMSYKIYSVDFQVLHNEAASEHCFVDMDFKPVRLKKEFPDIYEIMMSLVGLDLVEV